MKAAVFHGLGQPLAIETVPDPVAVVGQVILRVEACGVCGSDLHATDAGVFLQAPGTILGHEFSGEVVESRFEGIKKGTRATAVPINACGHCAMCREGRGILCTSNRITGLALDAPGAYAQYVKVDGSTVVPLPEGVSYEIGAMVEPLAVGLHAVDEANLAFGSRVLVIGAGPIGLSVATFARLRGAAHVVVSERAAARRKAALCFGATATIDPAETANLGDAFAEIASGPPDVIFDCVGVPGMIQACIDLSRPRGTVMIVGVCMKEDTMVPIAAILKELRLQFILGYVNRDFSRVLDVLGQGRIDAMKMLTNSVGLAELPTAFEKLRKPSDQIKLMIRPNA
jgi:(R,R)-butanediol dehydrogenase / meso-butanediol dehydrogenase / diacetyl reductase